MRIENNGWRPVILIKIDNVKKSEKTRLCRILYLKKNKISSS